MLKKIIILLLLLSEHAYAGINKAQQKIAVVDVQNILDQSSAIASVRSSIEKITSNLQKEFEQQEMSLKTKEAALLAKRSQMAEADFDKEALEFNKVVTNVQRQMQEKKTKLEQAHAQAVAEINQVAMEIIKDIAEKEKYIIVLPSTQLLFASSSLDISHDVLDRLNKKIPSIDLQF